MIISGPRSKCLGQAINKRQKVVLAQDPHRIDGVDWTNNDGQICLPSATKIDGKIGRTMNSQSNEQSENKVANHSGE